MESSGGGGGGGPQQGATVRLVGMTNVLQHDLKVVPPMRLEYAYSGLQPTACHFTGAVAAPGHRAPRRLQHIDKCEQVKHRPKHRGVTVERVDIGRILTPRLEGSRKRYSMGKGRRRMEVVLE